MKKLGILHKKHIFFIGIGGISMSGLAKLVLDSGTKVSGSDTGCGKEIEILESLGITIYHNHSGNNISSDIDLVVFTGAILPNNPEIVRSKELGIELMERSEFLGLVSQNYDKVIAIAGTHGKTTTTALIGEIFVGAGLNPTIHLGGESISLKGNTIIGGNEYFIVEACEYRESFRYLQPDIGVVTNIDLDHIDYYKNFQEIHNAFERFSRNCKKIVAQSDENLPNITSVIGTRGWEARHIKWDNSGYSFAVFYMGDFWSEVRLNMIGIHNITNTLFAIAVAVECGVEKSVVVETISSFKGVGRRYEMIANIDNCRIIIDYAHHPTELKCSIDGISSVYSKVLYVFQPHTYSRTLGLFDEFVDVLNLVNNLVLFKTYPAREEIIVGGTAMDLYSALNTPKSHFNTLKYIDNIVEMECFLKSHYGDFDCVLVLGAGDLAEKLKKSLKNDNK